MTDVLVATASGLHVLGDDDPAEVQLAGHAVTSIARDDDERWTIVDGSALWREGDEGWVEVAALEGHRATCLAFTDAWLVGSSEARLFRLEGGVLEPVQAFDDATGRSGWYTPWGGPPDTRSISEWGENVYVNVHVGGILRTDDGGRTWTPTIDVDADVHQVATSEGRVLAACAGGLVVSTDRGASWLHRTEGLEHRYARAVTVLGDAVLVSTSSGPRGGEAAVYRAGLAGGAFERCRAGLPEWFDGNIDSHCLDSPPDGEVAAFGTEDGRVFRTSDGGSTWEELAADLPAVRRILVLP